MMKSLAILAATLAAATQARQLSGVSNATQEGGKGDRRLADEEIDYMFNKNDDEMDCTEEDCGRRLQRSDNIEKKAKQLMSLLDTDGDGDVKGDEFFAFFGELAKGQGDDYDTALN